MSTEHTKEPWSACEAGGHIYINEAGGAGYVCNLVVHPHRSDEVRANARRIVACVNACAGIPTDDLEACPDGGVFHLADHANQLATQRDELLAAMTRAVEWAKPMEEAPQDARPEWFDIARAAIASAKGGME